MYHKCEIEFIYKPKGILESEDTFHSALSKFFAQEGYLMCPIKGEDGEYGFTIEPTPETIEKAPKITKIPVKPKKSTPSGY